MAGQQQVSTELQEVVMDACLVKIQDLCPDVGQLFGLQNQVAVLTVRAPAIALAPSAITIALSPSAITIDHFFDSSRVYVDP